MGIHGLSHFIKSFPSIVDNVQWKIDSQTEVFKEHFIVDGNAFVYHIAFENRTNWTHGGQYANISNVVAHFVNTLHKAGIRLTFLFDGALPRDKVGTRVKRHKSYIERCASTFANLKQINTSNKDAKERHNGIQYYGDLFLIPPLTLDVVVQSLKELKVQVQMCQGEADGEVVAMAAKEGAYVLSQDSDMHVYPLIGKGYIPFELLQVPVSDTDYVSAGVFHPETLAKMLNLKPYHLPLFGTLLGNDYVDVDIVRYPIGQWCAMEGVQSVKNNQNGWPKMVAEFIRRQTVEGEENKVIEQVARQLRPIIIKSNMKAKEEKAAELQDRIIDSVSRYDVCSPLLQTTTGFRNGVSGSVNSSITFISGNLENTKVLSRQIMDIIENNTFWTSLFLEDIERESSWDVSRALRQGLYGSIHSRLSDGNMMMVVNEYVRKKQHLEEIQVTGISIHKDTRDDFYRLHQSSPSDHLIGHEAVLHPLILCMRFMIYHCSQSIENGRLCNHEVVAMVISTLISLSPVLMMRYTNIPAPGVLRKRSIHLAAQFQGVIYSSYLLSQIMDIPDYFQLPCVLSHMYNGLYFHHFIEVARVGTSIERMLQYVSPECKALFYSVYKTILLDLQKHVVDVYDYKSGNSNKRLTPKSTTNATMVEQKQKNKKKKTSSTHSNNAFSVLSFGCNFDE